MKSAYRNRMGRYFTIRKLEDGWVFVSQWTGEVNDITLRGFSETIKSIFA